jgi:hypothetical protein
VVSGSPLALGPDQSELDQGAGLPLAAGGGVPGPGELGTGLSDVPSRDGEPPTAVTSAGPRRRAHPAAPSAAAQGRDAEVEAGHG